MQYWSVSLFAMMLAAAGLPLYIHLPRFASTELGLSLSTVGGVLIGIRVLDFLQDPVLGWVTDRWQNARAALANTALIGLAVGFLLLFSIPPQTGTVLWLTLSLVLLFTSYSLGSILFYGQSTALAGGGDQRTLYSLAAYREFGTILGIVIAAMSPTLLVLAGPGENEYRVFGLVLAIGALVVALTTRGLWSRVAESANHFGLADLRNSSVLPLLLLALVNSLPVAMTSTLFLFFVEDRLLLPDLSGPFLILFFLAAGLSVPVWTRALRQFGTRQVLVFAMGMSIASFIGAAFLSAGAAAPFGLICLVSGASLGADFVILPVLFSATLHRSGVLAGQAFGLWNFAIKLSLAVAALVLLSFLDAMGFEAGAKNSPSALTALTLSYAVFPCLIKIAAIVMVLRLPDEVLST